MFDYEDEFIEDLEKARKVSKKEMDEIFSHGDSNQMLEMLRRKTGISEEHLMDALHNGNTKVRERVSRHPNASQDVLRLAYHDPKFKSADPDNDHEHSIRNSNEHEPEEIKDLIGQHRQANRQRQENMYQRMLSGESESSAKNMSAATRKYVLQHKNAPEDVLKHAAGGKGYEIQSLSTRHGKHGDLSDDVKKEMLKNPDATWALNFRDDLKKTISNDIYKKAKEEALSDDNIHSRKRAIKAIAHNSDPKHPDHHELLKDMINAGHAKEVISGLHNRKQPTANDVKAKGKLIDHIVKNGSRKDVLGLLKSKGGYGGEVRPHIDPQDLREMSNKYGKSKEFNKALAQHMYHTHGNDLKHLDKAVEGGDGNRMWGQNAYNQAHGDRIYQSHLDSATDGEYDSIRDNWEDHFDEEPDHDSIMSLAQDRASDTDSWHDYMHEDQTDQHEDRSDLLNGLMSNEDFQREFTKTHNKVESGWRWGNPHSQEIIEKWSPNFADDILKDAAEGSSDPHGQLLNVFSRRITPHSKLSEDGQLRVLEALSKSSNHHHNKQNLEKLMQVSQHNGGISSDKLASHFIDSTNDPEERGDSLNSQILSASDAGKQSIGLYSQLARPEEKHDFKNKILNDSGFAGDYARYHESKSPESVDALAKHIDGQNNTKNAMAVGALSDHDHFKNNHSDKIDKFSNAHTDSFQNFFLANTKEISDNTKKSAVGDKNYGLLSKLMDRQDKGGIDDDDLHHLISGESKEWLDGNHEASKFYEKHYDKLNDDHINTMLHKDLHHSPKVAEMMLGSGKTDDKVIKSIADHHISRINDKERTDWNDERLMSALRSHGHDDNHQRVSLTHDSAKLRELKHHLKESGGTLGKKELEMRGMSPSALKINHLLDGKGNLSHDSLDQHIDSLPKQEYGYTHGETKNYGQQHDNKTSQVFQLHLTPEKLGEIKDAGLYDKFKDIYNKSEGGHPQRAGNGLGWVRYSSGDDGFHIDEIQSDLGSSLRRNSLQWANSHPEHSKIIKDIDSNLQDDPDHQAGEMIGWGSNAVNKATAKQYMKHKRDNGIKDEADQLSDIIFGGKHPSQVLHEGFLQHLRDSGHEGKEVHVWKPESKGSISLGNSSKDLPAHFKAGYGQIPKKMGYKDAQYGDLSSQTGKAHQGKDTWKKTLRKYSIIELMELLEKANFSLHKNEDIVVPDLQIMEEAMGYLGLLMKNMKTRVDKEPDGKQELDYGVEELDKESKKKKKKKDEESDAGIVNLDQDGNDGPERLAMSLRERWDLLKRSKLSSDGAFLDLAEAAGIDEDEDEEDVPNMEQEGDIDPNMEQEQEEAPEEGGQEEPNMENIDDPETHEMLQEAAQQEQGEPEAVSEEGEEGEEGEKSEEEGVEEAEQAAEQGASPEQIMQMLQEDGFSEAEIAHIMDGVNHGAVDPVQQKKLEQMEEQHGSKMEDNDFARQMKQQEHAQGLEHKKRMSDLEFESQSQKKQEIQLELEHKKRMLDLEYKKSQRMAEIEAKSAEDQAQLQLKMKELEAKHKMAIKKVENEAKSKMKMEDHAQKREETKDAE